MVISLCVVCHVSGVVSLVRNKLIAVLLILFVVPAVIYAQPGQLAATLEVLSAGVEVQRVGTTSFIPVRVEAIVGVGDTIRTDATGRARITFFADGVDTELLPQTEYRISRFEGDNETFTLSVEVLVGQTTQRIGRALSIGSSYEIETPTMALTARGTEFMVRVEATGRAGMLVSEGMVQAGAGSSSAEVPSEYGIRANPDAGNALSDVVRASTFEQLDAALDGCSALLTSPDDVSLNVRLSPNLDAPRIGTSNASEITSLNGTTEAGGWYRIAFRGGWGWVLSTSAKVQPGCAGLRIFPDNHGPEDVTLYEFVGDPVELTDLMTENATPVLEATSTPQP